jgi:heterodisulfide reductase subunit A-like polyferredoxin
MENEPLAAGELAKIADEFWLAYQNRLKADKIAAELKEIESKLSSVLMREMLNQDMTAIGGHLVQLALTKSDEPTLNKKEFDKFAEFVLASKDLSLLERRINKAAIKERWAAGVKVPGVISFPVYKLSKHEVK